jgi:hypothetical protein
MEGGVDHAMHRPGELVAEPAEEVTGDLSGTLVRDLDGHQRQLDRQRGEGRCRAAGVERSGGQPAEIAPDLGTEECDEVGTLPRGLEVGGHPLDDVGEPQPAQREVLYAPVEIEKCSRRVGAGRAEVGDRRPQRSAGEGEQIPVHVTRDPHVDAQRRRVAAARPRGGTHAHESRLSSARAW